MAGILRNLFRPRAVVPAVSPQLDELYAEATRAYLSKDFDRAIPLYERVIALQPDHAEAYYKLGNALKDLGQFAAALASYDKAIERKPDFAHALCNRGVVQQSLSLYEAALVSYDQALKLDPTDALVHANRGSLLQALSRWDASLASYDLALTLNSQLFQTWFHRGNVLREKGELEAALASYQEAIKLKPDYPEAHYNRGVLLERTSQLRAALASYERAIAIYPEFHQAHFNRAGVLKGLGEREAALVSYDCAIAAKGDYAEAYANRGVVLQELGRWETALASYDRAIAIRPDYAEAYFNRGTLFKALKRWDAELISYNRAIAIRPEYAEAHYNRSVASLLIGDFENGWLNYEWRWKIADRRFLGVNRAFPQPLWLGKESIAGKTLLIYAEQGLGDTLQFCRFAKTVADRGATVILEVQAPLATLLASVAGVSQILVQGSPSPECDYRCPLLSLPLALQTRVDTIPSPTRYLQSDAAKVAQWRARLGDPSRPRVGLTWSGNASNNIDGRRSIRLADWVAHLPPHFQYFCLQKDVRETDRAVLAASPFIASIDDDLLDFVNTAALCECMDLVISVDTSIAHLSAALGRPTWVLLPSSPDWRWLLGREDSPWYPTVKLYRQQEIGDWDGVFSRVAADLRKVLAAHENSRLG